MRVLVTGASGQVGHALLACQPQGVECLAPSSSELDLSQPQQISQLLGQWRPELIINAAAYTAVDRAESEPEHAFAVNASAVEHLSAAASAIGARLFQLSTDYVFPGDTAAPLTEDAPCKPLNVYGTSKLAGERAALGLGEQALVLRTSWVFGAHGNNFVKTMLRLGAERQQLGIVCDQTGGPTPAQAIAQALWKLAELPGPHGVFHYSGNPPCSWYDFAQRIFANAVQLGLLKQAPKLTPLTTAEYPTAAQRPASTVLDCTRLQRECGIAQPDWTRALTSCLQQMTTP
ncbi:dTDP-4-dehydrorhamnose reductase [Pseudomonas abyssi]|uniref:dTDP-4-dehydrorhamnose reductase n=1 Tax=Pseudomonas abyssi TaxID=170540 RepID=UPI003C7E00BA